MPIVAITRDIVFYIMNAVLLLTCHFELVFLMVCLINDALAFSLMDI